MNDLLVLECTPFDVACAAADFAVTLDDLKHSFPPELKAIARACVEKMHDVAEALAGDLACEIYGQPDGSETPRGEALIETNGWWNL